MGRLSSEDADRVIRLRPPYPPASDEPDERCMGPTGWHRPGMKAHQRGDRESYCTWCHQHIERRFGDPTWRATDPRPWDEEQRYLSARRLAMEGDGDGE